MPVAWDDVEALGSDVGWLLLSENGWGALIGWCAGTTNMRRRIASDDGRTKHFTRVTNGIERTWMEPFDESDRESLEEWIDGYLAEAGVPSRPSGFDWFIRVPSNFDTEERFSNCLFLKIEDAHRVCITPSEWLPELKSIFRDFYSIQSSGCTP